MRRSEVSHLMSISFWLFHCLFVSVKGFLVECHFFLGCFFSYISIRLPHWISISLWLLLWLCQYKVASFNVDFSSVASLTVSVQGCLVQCCLLFGCFFDCVSTRLSCSMLLSLWLLLWLCRYNYLGNHLLFPSFQISVKGSIFVFY